MEPIRPISRDLPKLEAIERVGRDAEREQQRRQQKKRPAPKRLPEPPEDDGWPHVDVSV
jgi:hypothetical protein